MNILLKAIFSMKYVLPPLKYAINSFFTQFISNPFLIIFDTKNELLRKKVKIRETEKLLLRDYSGFGVRPVEWDANFLLASRT